MTTALVTGATGFIGGRLVRALLDEGVQVRAMVRATSDTEQLERMKVCCVTGDFSDVASLRRAVRGADVVYHLAAMTSSIRRQDLMRVNGLGTARLVAACHAQPTPPTLIYVSSIAASGPTARGTIRQEGDPPRPVSNYGHSKRAGEVAVMMASHSVPATIVRPGIVFGENNREMLPVFRSIYRLRGHAIPGMSPPRLSFIHIDDLIDILLLVATRGHRIQTENGRNGRGIYFGVCPEHPNYAQLGRMIRPLLNRPYAAMLYMAQPLPWLLGGMGEVINILRGRSESLNVDKIREACCESWACSHQAVEKDLDFRFPHPLHTRLADTIRWYRDNEWL